MQNPGKSARVAIHDQSLLAFSLYIHAALQFSATSLCLVSMFSLESSWYYAEHLQKKCIEVHAAQLEILLQSIFISSL